MRSARLLGKDFTNLEKITMKKIKKYTFGMGDRFAHQGEAQLQAILNAKAEGIDVYPTWNKSFREHSIVGSKPQGLRDEADAAVKVLGWEEDYYVDADHIGLKTVDDFIPGSNFYTLDVADFVGAESTSEAIDGFLDFVKDYFGELRIEGISEPLNLTEAKARAAAGKFLKAISEAKAIYNYIAEQREPDTFVTEVSVDETDQPQTPEDLFFILAMIAKEKLPAQTIAPKFTGRFNKGVDYVGDLVQFEKEFEEDLCVIQYAIKELGLPEGLKLSVHSGSDKFSIYPIINKLIKKYDTGLHVKTAGTTWLEEVIGLAESGGEGLEIAKEIYAGALENFDALTAPYATVIDIDKSKLPTVEEVNSWGSEKFVETLRHDLSSSCYNLHFRQLIHVGFKIAAKMGNRFTDALIENKAIVAKNVTQNLFERHMIPILK